MVTNETKSTCQLCGKKFTGRGMGRHLQTCLPKQLDKAQKENKLVPCSAVHCLVSATNNKAFWLHLLIPADFTLAKLDDFLRGIWLECCDHLSEFSHGHEEISMDHTIDEATDWGNKIKYVYDFGSSTYLDITFLVGYTHSLSKMKDIRLLARNVFPEFPCDYCDQGVATVACYECQYENEGWLCETCAQTHSCFQNGDIEPYHIPNSPRAGVCGYVGNEDE